MPNLLSEKLSTLKHRLKSGSNRKSLHELHREEPFRPNHNNTNSKEIDLLVAAANAQADRSDHSGPTAYYDPGKPSYLVLIRSTSSHDQTTQSKDAKSSSKHNTPTTDARPTQTQSRNNQR